MDVCGDLAALKTILQWPVKEMLLFGTFVLPSIQPHRLPFAQTRQRFDNDPVY